MYSVFLLRPKLAWKHIYIYTVLAAQGLTRTAAEIKLQVYTYAQSVHRIHNNLGDDVKISITDKILLKYARFLSPKD